jgi:hypothetical protein
MKKYFSIILFTAAVTSLTSCLKDNKANLTADNSPAVVEWSTAVTQDVPNSPAGSTYPLYIRSYDIAPSVDVPFQVNYAGSGVAPEDITVNITVKPEAITQYNTERDQRDHQTSKLEALPTNLYEVPATVVIKKGERKATVISKLKTNLITNFSKEYVLALSISSATGTAVSGNYGTILVKTVVKNKFDGNYTVTATSPMVDITNATLTGYYPLNSDLVTTGEFSVKMYCYTYLQGLEGHPIKSGTSNSYYGNFAPVFTMDASGKVLSVTNFYGQGTNSNGRFARLDPSGVNKFTVSADGLTKTLEVSYVMQQAGPTDRTFFKEKWTFVKPR